MQRHVRSRPEGKQQLRPAHLAVSTYNTDTILVRAAQFDRAKDVLSAAGYVFV